jgi:glucose-6-phosphate 1-epimerase
LKGIAEEKSRACGSGKPFDKVRARWFMVTTDIPGRLRRFEIPGRVVLMEGNGELLKFEVTTDRSTAEIYLHGAQVTDFQKKGEPPLIFTSQFSRFRHGQAIRGGIPIVFPWFGAREGEPSHGFARISEWELHEATALPEGGVTLRFSLPETADNATWPAFTANYVVRVTDALELELIITNASPDQPFSFESCLHTYYAVGDVSAVSITGLKEASYLDRTEYSAEKTETGEAIKFGSEVDRTFFDTNATIEILDHKLGRRIRIEKENSLSTVVWNPWMAKSQQMPDFGNEEYKQMICVESGNVGKNRIVLPPGRSSVLKVRISSSPL